jgi:hypothetical protein
MLSDASTSQTDINLSDDGLTCVLGNIGKKKRKRPAMANIKGWISPNWPTDFHRWNGRSNGENLSVPKRRADIAPRPVNRRQARYAPKRCAQHPTSCDPAPHRSDSMAVCAYSLVLSSITPLHSSTDTGGFVTASTKGRLLTIRIGLIHAEIAAREGLR